MNEKTLLKLSLIFSIIGILGIIYISESISLKFTDVSDITKEDLDKKVRIKGEIENVVKTNEVTIINLKDNQEEITIIFFNNESLVKKHQKVEIIGTVTEYKGKLEVIADEIKVI